MTPDEIAAIRRRRALALDEAAQNLTVLTSLDDIPALLAEVERLTAQLAAAEAENTRLHKGLTVLEQNWREMLTWWGKAPQEATDGPTD